MRFSFLIVLSLFMAACSHDNARTSTQAMPASYAAAAPAQANDCEGGFDKAMTELEEKMAQPPPVL